MRALPVLTALAFSTLVMSGCTSSPASPSGPVPPGSLGVQVPNEGWMHVPEGTPISYRNNPPASGPHYPVWLRYEAYASPIPRGYWVHNLEHGAIVLIYRPDAPQAVVDALLAAYRSLPVDPQCGHTRALIVPDPELDRPWAAVAADWVLEADAVDATTIAGFTNAHRGHAPEQICDPGERP